MMIDGIEGYLAANDPEFLRQKARELPIGGSYLEIGSWMGLSSVIFAKELQRIGNISAKIYCVDTWQGSEEHQDLEVIKTGTLFLKFKTNIEVSGVQNFITPIIAPSIEAARNWEGPQLDMEFIDGDHTFNGCYNDILAWHHHLKVGGVMFGHDATENSPVMQAVKKAALEYKYEVSFFNPPHAHYMWVYPPKGL